MGVEGDGRYPMAERDWKSYNEGVVKRGELLPGFDFLDSWDEELEKMNSGKRGKPFVYLVSFVKFLTPLRVFFHLPYRQEEGFVQALSKFVPGSRSRINSIIYRRVSSFVPEFELA